MAPQMGGWPPVVTATIGILATVIGLYNRSRDLEDSDEPIRLADH